MIQSAVELVKEVRHMTPADAVKEVCVRIFTLRIQVEPESAVKQGIVLEKN